LVQLTLYLISTLHVMILGNLYSGVIPQHNLLEFEVVAADDSDRAKLLYAGALSW